LVVIALAGMLGISGLVLGPPLAVAIEVVGTHITRQVVLKPEAKGRPTIQERLALIRTQLDKLATPPAELTSILDRLNALVENTREVLPDEAVAKAIEAPPESKTNAVRTG
jgi:hypothetical protein